MSLSRSPIFNDLREHELQRIRRREEIEDGKRTTTIIGIVCAFGAFAFVAGIVTLGWTQ